MDNNTRPTSSFKTSGGHEIVHRTYINKLEEREITEIYLQSMDDAKASVTTGRAKFKADDKAVEIIIVSMDGTTEQVVERTLALPTGEYKEIEEIIKGILEPKKN